MSKDERSIATDNVSSAKVLNPFNIQTIDNNQKSSRTSNRFEQTLSPKNQKYMKNRVKSFVEKQTINKSKVYFINPNKKVDTAVYG